MRIHELAQAMGVSARSLRYYESQGLLKPDRSPNGYREYSNTAVAVIDRIRSLLSAGLSTFRIRAVLACFLEEGPKGIECPALRKQLADEVQRLENQIWELERSRDLLRSALESEGRPISCLGASSRARGSWNCQAD